METNIAMMRHLQQLIVALIDVPQRRDAACNLAKYLGAADLLIFIRDPEIAVPLPAPGFQQTLPEGRLWRKFVEQCSPDGIQEAELPFPTAQTQVPATAITGQDGTVLVLLGGRPMHAPMHAEIQFIGLQLPLLGAIFRSERVVLTAQAQARTAREAAEQARSLAGKLDATRSELHRALVVAEAASRIKDEFLATLSHELRTPLTAIIAWSQMMGSGHLNEDTKAQALDVIQRSARLQAQLVEDILDVSRIVTGKLRLEARPTELSTVIEDAIASVLPAAQAKEIRLQRVLDSGGTLVSGDPARLQQVVWNLLSNAIKFTPKGGRVQVRLERMNSHLEIIVSDTGAGIPPEILPYIFDRFRQADQSSTRNHGGLGLGLSIVRHIVEMHGGTVDVESPGEGQGAIFTVKLPLMATRSVEVTHSQTESRIHPSARSSGVNSQTSFICPQELDGLHILVVDDDEDSRLVVKAVLESCRARVTTADSAADGLRKLQSARPDVLISDIGMPGEDGYALIRKVRALNPQEGGQILAVALTAYARLEDRLQVLRSGFQTHLPKPVEPAELVAVVANLTHRIG